MPSLQGLSSLSVSFGLLLIHTNISEVKSLKKKKKRKKSKKKAKADNNLDSNYSAKTAKLASGTQSQTPIDTILDGEISPSVPMIMRKGGHQL